MEPCFCRFTKSLYRGTLYAFWRFTLTQTRNSLTLAYPDPMKVWLRRHLHAVIVRKYLDGAMAAGQFPPFGSYGPPPPSMPLRIPLLVCIGTVVPFSPTWD